MLHPFTTEELVGQRRAALHTEANQARLAGHHVVEAQPLFLARSLQPLANRWDIGFDRIFVH